jgi:hypothetical protein
MEHRYETVGVDAFSDDSRGDLAQLLSVPVESAAPAPVRQPIAGAVVGTLVGFADAGATPLVTYPAQPGTAALLARATLDLHGAHIGRPTVLVFEDGDPCRPIIVGCVKDERAAPLEPGQVEVDVDGQRLLVSAKDRIVLRCGKASITLTKEGKLILQGEYVSSLSSGVLRIKGGSVQIN